MPTKKETRKANLEKKRLTPKWWRNPPSNNEFDAKERKRRRKKARIARATRKRNRETS